MTAEVTPKFDHIPGYDPATAPRQDLEARTAELLAATAKQDAIACYNATCPPEYRELDPRHPTAVKYRQAIGSVLGWIRNPKGLMITGPTGRCKTRAVWALLRRLAHEDGVITRAYHSQDFFSALAGEVKYGRDDAAAWIDRKAWHPVVFIDDFGQEALLANREDWAQGWWLRFVDLRLQRGLPLILTTNLTSEGIAEAQASGIRSEPLLRRLREMCTVVRFQ